MLEEGRALELWFPSSVLETLETKGFLGSQPRVVRHQSPGLPGPMLRPGEFRKQAPHWLEQLPSGEQRLARPTWWLPKT